MKKNILLFTTIYPAPDLKYGTQAIHYFTKEWVKMGYRVKVVHFLVVYPSILYTIARYFRDIIASRTGNIVFTKKEKEDKNYMLDGVKVDRIPIFKWIPHGKFTKKEIEKALEKIIQKNQQDEFVPDLMMGHFSNPHLEIITKLKQRYPAKTCMVMHDVGKSIQQIYPRNYQQLMKSIDVWGYRSMPIKNKFESTFGVQSNSFMCYSGIPASYITDKNDRSFDGKLSRFIYVGELIARKHPTALVKALYKVYPEKNYQITYIGKGAEEMGIRALATKYEVNDCILLKGKIPRDEIPQILDTSECFIMISSNETFGLVYLEAMSRGCLTIGSRNEGIDGIIEHGINGFLCEAGNEEELTVIIKHINQLSPQERRQISQNAIATAQRLTDDKVAKNYISSVNY